jgi:hypothetical protein
MSRSIHPDGKAAIRAAAPELKAKFRSPAAPQEFVEALDEINEEHGYELITTPDSKFYKEAWLAGRFANQRGATLVWLGEDPPDFWLKVRGAEHSYEITEILRPGRRRDLEVREVYENGPQHDPEENWLTVEQIAELVTKAVISKSDDRYKGVAGLLVYANTGFVKQASTIQDSFVDLIITLRKQDWSSTPFGEIWVSMSTHCDWIALPVVPKG